MNIFFKKKYEAYRSILLAISRVAKYSQKEGIVAKQGEKLLSQRKIKFVSSPASWAVYDKVCHRYAKSTLHLQSFVFVA